MMLARITDACQCRLVVDPCGAFVHLGRPVVTLSGAVVGVGGAVTGFLDALSCQLHVIVGDGLPARQRGVAVDQLASADLRSSYRTADGDVQLPSRPPSVIATETATGVRH